MKEENGITTEDTTAENTVAPKGGTLKLDFKRTILVGFAFFGIMCFWEVYDYIMPLILNTRFGLNSWQYGLIMGLDNLLAIFLLPLFGSLSDKSKGGKMGRRTRFIFWGTIAAAVAILILSIFEFVQFKKIMDAGYNSIEALSTYSYTYNDTTQLVSALFARDDVVAFLGQQGIDVNLPIDYNAIMSLSSIKGLNAADTAIVAEISSAIKQAQIAMGASVVKNNAWVLVMFIISLLLLLVAMASYRSPAVSLMPDITPKPLRSQANAIITFMGGAGGLVAIVLYKIFANAPTKNYLYLFISLAVVLLVVLLVYMLTVKENKFVELREEEEQKFNVVDEEEAEGTDKLPKAKLVSLFLILMTVFLWFMGYNAVKSHLSTYATGQLNFTQGYVGTLSILNGAGGAIALLPVAFLANKLGRKKTVIIGIIVAVLAFIPCFFMKATTPGVKYLFPLCYLLAGFGMVCVNVNTLPMVTELSRGSTVGKYTGYYYAFSMSAQAVTPAFAGIFMDKVRQSSVFIYAAVFIGLALVTTIFIKHGDNKPPKKKKMLEYFSDED